MPTLGKRGKKKEKVIVKESVEKEKSFFLSLLDYFIATLN